MSDDQPKGAPDWIVTFSDIISLLVTFFVMMLTWSTLEMDKFDRAIGSLQGSLGAVHVDKQQELAVQQEVAHTDRSEADGMLTRPDAEPIEKSLRNLGLRLKKRLGETIDTEVLHENHALRITPAAGFQPGSAALSPSLRHALDAIAEAAGPLVGPIHIAGHTDDREPPGRYPSRWALAAARAAAAARHLAAGGQVLPQRIAIAACADRCPLYPNGLDALRPGNRRLEVTLFPEPEPRR
jgi:chemotaxis protein MotB